jgi:hypothetical protein
MTIRKGVKKMNKKIILCTVTVVAAGALTLGVASVNAQTNTSPMSGLVAAIAQKFGLDQAKVQATVDDYKKSHKNEMHANMQAHLEDRLSALVKNGKITEAQKTAIINELNTLKTKYPMTAGMTKQQRMQAMQNMQNEFKSWATSQGINTDLLPGLGGFKRGWLKGTPSQ